MVADGEMDVGFETTLVIVIIPMFVDTHGSDWLVVICEVMYSKDTTG